MFRKLMFSLLLCLAAGSLSAVTCAPTGGTFEYAGDNYIYPYINGQTIPACTNKSCYSVNHVYTLTAADLATLNPAPNDNVIAIYDTDSSTSGTGNVSGATWQLTLTYSNCPTQYIKSDGSCTKSYFAGPIATPDLPSRWNTIGFNDTGGSWSNPYTNSPCYSGGAGCPVCCGAWFVISTPSAVPWIWGSSSFLAVNSNGYLFRQHFQLGSASCPTSLLVTPTPTVSTPTVTRTWTFSPTRTITRTSTPTLTVTPTFSQTFSLTPSPTASPTRTHTPTVTQTVSFTPSVTRSHTPTATPTATQTVTFTPSVTFTVTLTQTPTATRTVTFTPSATYTATLTATPTATRTITFTASVTFTPSLTATPTATQTVTFTPSTTFTFTPTATPTATQTVTFTPSTTFTFTPTETLTGTQTVTFTPSTTFTFTPTVTPTATQTVTFTPSTTFTFTPTHTLTATQTVTFTPSSTFTHTPTDSPTATQSVTSTSTSSSTATPTATPTRTVSPQFTLTDTGTLTLTRTPTATGTWTPTVSPTSTASASPTETLTASPSFSSTATVTDSPTSSPTPTVTATFTPAAPYQVKLTVYNSAGEVVGVIAEGLPVYQEPTGIQAPQDGFVPDAGGYASFLVLNGSSTQGQVFTWDGTSQDGQRVSSGTYLVQAEFTDSFGHVTTFTASATVVRQARTLSVDVYNSAGELVRHLETMASNAPGQGGVQLTSGSVTSDQPLGILYEGGTSVWDGTSDAGTLVATGQYLVRLTRGAGQGGTEVFSQAVTVFNSSADLLGGMVVAPNPVGPADSAMKVYLPAAMPGMTVKALIYDLAGELTGQAEWDGSSNSLVWNFNQGQAPGIYLIRVDARDSKGRQASRTLKAVLLR